MHQNKISNRYFYALNGFVSMLFLGCSFTWSIFVVPLETAFGWARSQTSLAFTLNMFFYSIGIFITGILSSRISYKTLQKLAAFLICIGFFASGFACKVWHIYLSYSVLCGCGIGIGYNTILSTVPLWFPKKSGTITGILLMGFALSTALLAPAVNALIGSIGISSTFRVLSAVIFAGLFCGSFFIEVPTFKEISKSQKETAVSKVDIPPLEMVKMPIFWLYFISCAFAAGAGLTTINHASPLMIEELMISSSSAAFAVSFLSLSNGFGRMVWGAVYDKSGFKTVISLQNVLIMVSVAVVVLSLKLRIPYLFIGDACILMFLYGGVAATVPIITRDLFGNKYFSINYAILPLNSFISSSFPTFIGSLRVLFGNYQMPYIVLLGVLCFNIILLVFMLISYNNHFIKHEN